MRDLRNFDVMVGDERKATAAVQAARDLATLMVRNGVKGVRLRNVETGERFKWWPELGV